LRGTPSATTPGSTSPTKILTTQDAEVQRLAAIAFIPGSSTLDALQAAHGLISKSMRPVYAMNDQQPVAKTVKRNRGSCSQRMAVLEAVARASGVQTRVQGLIIDGSFWYQRFPALKLLIPKEVVLAWPEFLVDGEWLSFSDLFGSVCAVQNSKTFTNRPGETLFEAVAANRISFTGGNGCNLSEFILQDLGYFENRDELFVQQGQTLHWFPLFFADRIFNRWASV
jgi:hypothetical protein